MDEGGSSGSSGPAVPDDVEESDPVKKLVAPISPNSGQTGRSTLASRTCSVQDRGVESVASDVAECISIVQEEEKPRIQRLPFTLDT